MPMALGLGLGLPYLGAARGPYPALDLNFAAMAVSGVLDPRVTFSRGSLATLTNAAGTLEVITSGNPRFTYDPVTHAALGLLIEEQRTNLLLWSEAFDNAAWSGTNVTITKVAGAPDGSSNLNKIQATAAAATLIRQNATVASTAATFSVYVKQGSGATDGNAFVMRNATTATILLNFTVNYTTGAIAYTTGSSGVSMTDVGGGVWRLVMTATSGITSGNDIEAYAFYPGNSETAGEYVYAWGAQLEAGAFATSYIPTTTATVTRAADSATMTGMNFSSWFNATQGTFVAEASTEYDLPAINRSIVTARISSSYANFMDLRRNTSRKFGTEVYTSSASQIVADSGSVGALTGKVALAYASNDARLCVNGGSIVSDATFTAPACVALLIGADAIGSGIWNAPIARLRYYPTALTNAQLQALTT